MERSSERLPESEKNKVQECDSAGNKEENQQSPRVIFNAGDITVVRRPGEGSRPIFDRDEIHNHERMSDEERRRYRHNFSQNDANIGDRRRGYDSQRIRYYRERLRRERCARRCPTCHRYSTCFPENEETYASYYGDRLYRARSDERMFRDHSYLYHEHYPSDMCYYQIEDPSYYEVVGSLILHPSLSYTYFGSCEY